MTLGRAADWGTWREDEPCAQRGAAAAAKASAAYTIGKTSSYDRSLMEEPEVFKLGPEDGYDGGWVFRTEQEARDALADLLSMLMQE